MVESFHSNPCGSDSCDYLQVKVTSECNGSCDWCVEKRFGFTPTVLSLGVMESVIETTDKQNIVFMGGEPTLSSKLLPLIRTTIASGKSPWVWSNAHSFGRSFVSSGADLFRSGIAGATLSIHHFDLGRNQCITGCGLDEAMLVTGVKRAASLGIKIHLTCNLIAGEIDTESKIWEYIQFAKRLGVEKVRFSELVASDSFVGLLEILSDSELSRDPFIDGCQVTTVIDGLGVLLATVCGLQTPKRPAPCDAELSLNPVLYEDGRVRAGWVVEGSSRDHAN